MQRYGLEFSYREYFADAVVHVTGVVLALIAATALVVWAAMTAPVEHISPLVVYAAGLIACFALSAAYNMTVHRRARRLLQKLDHAAIFIMIAGTYTPIALIGIGGTWGAGLAVTAWGLAALGVALKLVFTGRFERLAFALYLAQGWLAVIALVPMSRELSLAVMLLIGAGGVLFTVGTVFHVRDHWPYNRAIWHALVLAAAGLHYSAVVAVAAS